jgi:hypothetical protein
MIEPAWKDARDEVRAHVRGHAARAEILYRYKPKDRSLLVPAWIRPRRARKAHLRESAAIFFGAFLTNGRSPLFKREWEREFI